MFAPAEVVLFTSLAGGLPLRNGLRVGFVESHFRFGQAERALRHARCAEAARPLTLWRLA